MFATTLNLVSNASGYTCQALPGCAGTFHVTSLTPPEGYQGVMGGSHCWCYFCSCPNRTPPPLHAPAAFQASFDMTPLSAMWGISAAIQGANPRHIAWPIPKRGLHASSKAFSHDNVTACAVASERVLSRRTDLQGLTGDIHWRSSSVGHMQAELALHSAAETQWP